MDTDSALSLSFRQRLIVGAAALLVLTAGTIAMIVSRPNESAIDAGLSTEPTTAPTSAPTTVPSTTAAQDTTTTSTATTATTELTAETMPLFDAAGLERTVVAELANGVVFVRYSEPTEEDCGGGDLVGEYDGEVVRVYNEVGFAGGIRAYPGPFDAVALVGNCEEETSWIMFADNLVSLGAPLAPAAPDLTPVYLPNRIGSMRDFGWVGNTGYFGATATFYNQTTSWNDAVVMSPETNDFMLAAGTIGETTEVPPVGVQLMVPNDWTVSVSDDVEVLVEADDSDAYLRIVQTAVELPEPTAGPGESFELRRSVRQEFWFTGESGGLEYSHTIWTDELFFRSIAGVRGIRSIVDDGNTWEIEHFTPASDGSAPDSVGAFAANMVTIVTSFG